MQKYARLVCQYAVEINPTHTVLCIQPVPRGQNAVAQVFLSKQTRNIYTNALFILFQPPALLPSPSSSSHIDRHDFNLWVILLSGSLHCHGQSRVFLFLLLLLLLLSPVPQLDSAEQLALSSTSLSAISVLTATFISHVLPVLQLILHFLLAELVFRCVVACCHR